MNLLTDSEIRRMVAELPRPEPPEGFAAGVMARVRAEERRRRWRPWFLAAAAAVVVASAFAISLNREPAAPPVAADSGPPPLEDPREELAAIQDEVRSLREAMALMDALGGAPSTAGSPLRRRAPAPGPSAAPTLPLVRIGGDDDLGLFLDIESLLDGGAFPARPSAVSPRALPASDRSRR